MENKNKNKCPLCPKEYQSKNERDRHLKRIHGIDLAKDCFKGDVGFIHEWYK